LEIWGKFKSLLGARPKNNPVPQTIPNQNFAWGILSKNYKQVLPKSPTVVQLRNFAKNPIVRRPINLIEDQIVRLSGEFVNVDPADIRDYKIQKTIVQNILDNPNVIHNHRAFLKMLIDDLVTIDAGVFEKAVGGDPNRPLFLYPTDGSTIQWVVPYDYTDVNAARYAQLQYKDGIKYFTAGQLAYLQRNYFTDKPQGLSPVLSAYNYIVYLLNAGERADGVANNATADFLVNLGENITDPEREAFIKYMEEDIEGTGKIPVAAGSNGIETKQIRAINKDGLYLEWQQFLIGIIALAFGIPREKMGLILSNDRSTVEELDELVLKELVKPYADIIEDAINEHVLKVLGYDKFFRFKFVYTDTEAQKKLKSDRINNNYVNGIITKNQALVDLGYPKSDSEYADMDIVEAKAKINKDYYVQTGGFNGQGQDNYDDKNTDNKQIKE